MYWNGRTDGRIENLNIWGQLTISIKQLIKEHKMVLMFKCKVQQQQQPFVHRIMLIHIQLNRYTQNNFILLPIKKEKKKQMGIWSLSIFIATFDKSSVPLKIQWEHRQKQSKGANAWHALHVFIITFVFSLKFFSFFFFFFTL